MQTSKLQDMFFITIFQYAERNRKHTKHLFTNISYGKLASSCFTCITFQCTLHPLYIHMTIIFIVVLNLRNVFMNLSNSFKLILEALQYQNTNRQWLQLQMIIHYTYNYISIRLMLANFIIKYKINFTTEFSLEPW